MKRRYIFVLYVPPLPIISAGQFFHSLELDKYGQVWGWGYNGTGQLGDNTATQRLTPVSILGDKKTFCKIAVGQQYSLGIDNNGQVWGWGANFSGQLGDNSFINRYTPVSILGDKKTFCKISGGQNYSIGFDKYGQVWGWGYNSYGQLGDNTTSVRLTPVSILGDKKTFCNIANSYFSTIGLDKNGQVWGWGYNYYGQLGNNSYARQLTPVSILGNEKTFCNISAGQRHTMGIDKYGQVWGWGYNFTGALGDNTNMNQSTPISILGNKKTFCKISAGYANTFGIDKYGQVWGWGYNYYGQLGDNTTINQSTPVSIFGNKKTFCNISAGYSFTMLIDKNGQAWGWGRNGYGNLGDNTTTNQNTPVRVCNL